MNNLDILKSYIPMVDFISEILGENSEVVLHDINNADSSIVYIKNGHLSGRTVGGPLTDLVLKVVQNRIYDNENFLANYKALGNSKAFKSSSYFIKNQLGEIIGVLCVNTDTKPYQDAQKLLEGFLKTSKDFSPANDNQEEAEENLCSNTTDLLSSMIKEALEEVDIPPSRMNSEEKKQLIGKLYDKGTFQMKGAVTEASKALLVSEPTIYRYISIYKD
ncbi:PAS domain-containing protein [Clostridium sp. 19966]|uniref:helix-turn-helix transcriptional regulator n=1 Tax=Clostridium sp. 19966 TaxID=2768166 RepID=UPI0028DE7F7D|nr:PAS domain-containing protein [Clostridium sp. 19966]MDT8715889.1 PAS domain-containing protein [Clostridium sp. 19966]